MEERRATLSSSSSSNNNTPRHEHNDTTHSEATRTHRVECGWAGRVLSASALAQSDASLSQQPHTKADNANKGQTSKQHDNKQRCKTHSHRVRLVCVCVCAVQFRSPFPRPPRPRVNMAMQKQQPGYAQPVPIYAVAGPRFWSVDLAHIFCEEPLTCLYSCFCGPCQAYQQRQRLLAFTGEPYSCCGWDTIPRSKSCCWDAYQPPARVLPPVWPPLLGQEPEVMRDFQPKMCLESFCCLGCSVGSTRAIMRYKFGVNDSDCDLACICGVVIACMCFRRQARQLAYAMLIGCMFAQQDLELRIEEQKRIAGGAIGSPGPARQIMGSPVVATVPYQAQPTQQQYQSPPAAYGQPQQQQQYQPQQVSQRGTVA